MGAAVVLYDFEGNLIGVPGNPLTVDIGEFGDDVSTNGNTQLKTTLYDENGNAVDTLSQVDLLGDIIKQLKINNLHLAMLTDMVITREDI